MNARDGMRVTINDLARASGYSKTTVSFAFNEPDRISKETRDKILKLAEEMGYVPDPVARNLAIRKLTVIGMLLPQIVSESFKNPYLADVLRGVADSAQRDGYSVTLVAPLKGYIHRAVRGAAVDGFVSVGLDPDEELEQLIRRRGIPLVNVDGRSAEGVPSVTIDDRCAAATIMDRVLREGHRRIGFLTLARIRLEDTELGTRTGDLRMAGYDDALRRYGLSLRDPRVTRISCEVSVEGGRLGTEKLLSIKEPPTVIVAMSDIMAIGAYAAIAARGLAIPRDISVVGFDDITVSSCLSPRLTTIAQPGYEKGFLAGKLLFKIFRREEYQSKVVLGTRLVEGGSVSAPVD